MGENAKPKPTVQVPPRVSTDFLSALGFSPGPMTLVSNLFPEQAQLSFSQLLAGAMASPLAPENRGSSSTDDLGKDNRNQNSSDLGKSAGSRAGDKSNRPANLVVPPPAESLAPLLLNSPGFLSPLQSPFGMSHQQALAHVTAQAAYSQSFAPNPAELPQTLPKHSSAAPSRTSTANPSSQEPEISKIDPPEPFQPDKPAGDGYNWRKYGQKQVKASECPRSYYKCTFLNCPVKKKVECTLDGRISEITYRGQHNHDPPQPNKRVKDSSTAKSQDKTVLPPQCSALDTTNAVAVPASNFQTLEYNNQVANHNDVVEDAAEIVVDEKDEDEPVAKRRNVNTGTSVPATTHQTVTDSKIVLQTRSEVDLLDDGYRWRKYGQKVVKGNPYPRSYYKCTYMGCNVRKHVERASSDPKAVITTYEGKHDHDVPVGRYSSSNGTSQQKKKSSENTEMEVPMSLQLKEESVRI